MTRLSKSKLTMAAQCPRKLWLYTHNRVVATENPQLKRIAERGTEFGDRCRTLFPGGILIDTLDSDEAVRRTRKLMDSMNAFNARPIYEAAFIYKDVVVRVDIMTPVVQGEELAWKLIEIKSGNSRESNGRLKHKYILDAAIQQYVVTNCDIPVVETHLGTPNPDFVYQSMGSYEGVLVTEKINSVIEPLLPSIPPLIGLASPLVECSPAPAASINSHCSGCEFVKHCTNAELTPDEQFRVPTWFLASSPNAVRVQSLMPVSRNLADIPEAKLTAPMHKAMRRIALGEMDTYIDPDLRVFLAEQPPVRWFIDFEFMGSPLPLWQGTSPNHVIPFQFSMHKWHAGVVDTITHSEFISDTSEDPRPSLIKHLIAAYDESGPVYSWHGKAIEGPILERLADLVGGLERKILLEMASNCKRDDLLPHFNNHFYTLGMEGWSLKQVAKHFLNPNPYDILETQNGVDAMNDYEELLSAQDLEKRAVIKKNLLKYCEVDTFTLIAIWKKLEVTRTETTL